jgi:hypothetical protein
MSQYPFREEETGNLQWLTFEQMMEADCMGVVKVKGKTLRRARDIERGSAGNCVNDPPPRAPERVQIVSDAMGFPAHQLSEFESDRQANKIRGIEFERDPDVPSFIRVRCDSREAFNRYAKHRGLIDKSHKNGSSASMTKYDFELARKRVMDQYPVAAK